MTKKEIIQQLSNHFGTSVHYSGKTGTFHVNAKSIMGVAEILDVPGAHVKANGGPLEKYRGKSKILRNIYNTGKLPSLQRVPEERFE
jgi:hypothetical protein